MIYNSLLSLVCFYEILTSAFVWDMLNHDRILVLLIADAICQFHPDVNKDARAGERFKSIRCSYEVSIAIIKLCFFPSIAHI